LLKRDAPLWIAIFLDLVGFSMAVVDIQFRAGSLGAPGWQIGAVQASTFIIQLIVSPLWGRLSDRIGRKTVFVACTALSAASMAVYASADVLWLLLAARILSGLGSANVAVAQAATADAYEGDQRAAALGRLSAALSAGLIAGPWIVSLMGQIMAGRTEAEVSRSIGLLGAGCSALGALLVLVFAHMPRGGFEQKKRSLAFFPLVRQFPNLAPLLIAASVAWFSLAMLEGTFGRLLTSMFHSDQPKELAAQLARTEFGLIFGFESGLAVLVSGVLLIWILKKLGQKRAVIFGLLAQGLGLALTPFMPAIGFVFGASMIYSVGSGVANPTINSLCSDQVPKDQQGELFGVLQAGRAIGFGIGPVLGGALFDAYHPGPYLVAGVVSAAAALLIFTRKDVNPPLTEGEEENQVEPAA
jgi:MFS family permease